MGARDLRDERRGFVVDSVGVGMKDAVAVAVVAVGSPVDRREHYCSIYQEGF